MTGTRAPVGRHGVRTHRITLDDPRAECRGCGWYRNGDAGRDWPAVRSAAQRHIASTGHVVIASRVQSFVYAPKVNP